MKVSKKNEDLEAEGQAMTLDHQVRMVSGISNNLKSAGHEEAMTHKEATQEVPQEYTPKTPARGLLGRIGQAQETPAINKTTGALTPIQEVE